MVAAGEAAGVQDICSGEDHRVRELEEEVRRLEEQVSGCMGMRSSYQEIFVDCATMLLRLRQSYRMQSPIECDLAYNACILYHSILGIKMQGNCSILLSRAVLLACWAALLRSLRTAAAGLRPCCPCQCYCCLLAPPLVLRLAV